MTRTLFVEGANRNSKSAKVQCREAFSKLLRRLGLRRMPRIEACGGRGQAYKDFCTEFATSADVRLLVDSEEPVDDIERTWEHLLRMPEQWIKPTRADDEHVLLMTTCMETWIVADHVALRSHYAGCLRGESLPEANPDLERLPRRVVLESLENATADCRIRYKKGKRSFKILAEVDPVVLAQHLPSFARAVRILKQHA